MSLMGATGCGAGNGCRVSRGVATVSSFAFGTESRSMFCGRFDRARAAMGSDYA